MAALTVTARGQVALRKEVLRHLGIRPGGRTTLDPLPDGRAELRAVSPQGSWADIAGRLEGKTNGARLSLDGTNEAIAEAGAEAGLGGS